MNRLSVDTLSNEETSSLLREDDDCITLMEHKADRPANDWDGCPHEILKPTTMDVQYRPNSEGAPNDHEGALFKEPTIRAGTDVHDGRLTTDDS